MGGWTNFLFNNNFSAQSVYSTPQQGLADREVINYNQYYHPSTNQFTGGCIGN